MQGAITAFVMLALWAERRFIARLQDRLGPNRVGKFGLLQSVADAVKLLAKEIIRPALVDRTLHFLAPMMILGASLMIWTSDCDPADYRGRASELDRRCESVPM